MRWYRHSHSYSEGELSKSASIGRASSRGQEGHRFEFEIGNAFPYFAFVYPALVGLVGITALAAEEHHRWNVFLSLPTFWLAFNHMRLKREGEDPESQGSLVIPEKATLVWWGRPTCSSGGRGGSTSCLTSFLRRRCSTFVDAVSAPYLTSLVHSFVIWPWHSPDH